MARIVISEFMDDAAVAVLRASHEVEYRPDLVEAPTDLARAVANADALIVRNRTQVTAAVLDAGPHLRVVGRLGVGLDNIDIDACAARSIVVRPATGANAIAVAEYVIGAMLALIRGVFGATEALLEGEWPRTELTGGEAHGRTLGLIGYGSIAREVAHRAATLQMEIAAHDPYLADEADWRPAVPMTLPDLLESSDVISIHVPLLPATFHLIDADAIADMRTGSILINTSRGGVVDESAVVAGLRSGQLSGAALDVFEDEPPTPSRLAEFAAAPNLVLTPHIAGVTRESNVRVSRAVADAVVEELAHG